MPLDDNITYFSIAEESIPKTSSNKKYNKPWFDDDCKAAIRSRKAALCKFNLQPSAENFNNFKIHRAKTRRVIKTSKKTSWGNYVNKQKSSSRSARKSYLRCLDSIHHLGLRLGALRTSPVESLYVEANEATLSLRREKLVLQYYTKLQSCPSNPAFECTIDPKYKEMFARKESAIPSFGIRIQSLLDTSNIPNDNVHATVIPQVPPWTMHRPKVCLDLSVQAKIDTPSHIYIQKFNEIKDQYSYCTRFDTDGSKDNDRVGCGLVISVYNTCTLL